MLNDFHGYTFGVERVTLRYALLKVQDLATWSECLGHQDELMLVDSRMDRMVYTFRLNPQPHETININLIVVSIIVKTRVNDTWIRWSRWRLG